MLTVGVLGPLQVRRDGELVPIPAGKTTEVLVRLALDASTSVRAEGLISDLWANSAAKNTLQSKVSQLRRALGRSAAISSAHGGYTLEIEPSAVDALRALELSAAASSHWAAGDAAATLDTATEGLSLFRGELLVDAGDGEWLRPHRARLDEIRLGLFEAQLSARMQLALGPEVIGELQTLVHRYPLREGLWHLLITALYRSGRQADALAAYSRVRQLLVEELGIEPGPDLQDLEAQVLQHSAQLQPSAAGDRSPTSGNLPALSGPLLGRAAELTDLCARIEQHRLVSVVGPAGVGKTRLAIEAARRIAASRETWLVRLDALDASMSIGRAVAETLQVATEAMVLERLSGTATLLVLDNCEHVMAQVVDLTRHVLDSTPRCHILTTGQRALGLDGEQVRPLDPLPLEDSSHCSPAMLETCGGSSSSTPRLPRPFGRSASRSTVCRWQSSSRRRACARCRWRRSRVVSTIGLRWCVTRPARPPTGGAHSVPRSHGAMTCCSRTISVDCGRCPASPAAPSSPPPNTCSAHSMCRRRPRST